MRKKSGFGIVLAALSNNMLMDEFQGISEWINSNPLTIAELKGNVILIQFWTFSCINCQRTLPYMTQWHSQYATQGLKVIGVHTPEFAFERDRANIEKALRQHQITYPVPVDIAIIDLVRYRSEGELPYRPYSDALH